MSFGKMFRTGPSNLKDSRWFWASSDLD